MIMFCSFSLYIILFWIIKWLVKEARTLSSEFKESRPKDAELLNAFGHSQAAKEVYGCDFFKWKMKYPQKESLNQMERFHQSVAIHAVHTNEDKLTLKSTMTVAMTQEFNSKFKVILEAGAFRSLCHHLTERSDTVQNIDLMTVSGFCRNCLAKWLVIEARKLSNSIRDANRDSFNKEETEALLASLDSFGYDQAAEAVYGCDYKSWKEAHQKKASEEQLALYNASVSIHAKHDKKMLESGNGASGDKQGFKEVSTKPRDQTNPLPSLPKSMAKAAPLSDVCCEDVDVISPQTCDRSTKSTSTRSTPLDNKQAFRSPPPPRVDLSLKIGILTVSDRAAAGEYATGDLSGPAVEQAIIKNLNNLNSQRPETDETSAKINFVAKSIVPDEEEQIISQLLSWSGKVDESISMDIIFTTGGTGFSARDITPEATLKVIERECGGLMSFITSECALIQPLAALSRGRAGLIGKTIIANLPGNPNGVGQCINILLPLLLHAVKDLKRNSF